MSMEKREEVEQDTLESQDIEDIFEFLLPPGTIPKKCSTFGLLYNKKALDGWSGNLQHVAVLLDSWRLERAYGRASRPRNGVESHHCASGISCNDAGYDRKEAKIIRKEARAEIDPLLKDISSGLESLGRRIGGKKAVGATKKAVMAIIKGLAGEHYEQKRRERENNQREMDQQQQDVETLHCGPSESGSDEVLSLPPIRSDSPSSSSSSSSSSLTDKQHGSRPPSSASARGNAGEKRRAAKHRPSLGRHTHTAVECIVELLEADGYDFEAAAKKREKR